MSARLQTLEEAIKRMASEEVSAPLPRPPPWAPTAGMSEADGAPGRDSPAMPDTQELLDSGVTVSESPWWHEQEEIVLSGISGRFPDSANMAEFAANLFSGYDMVTEDNRRWDPGMFDLPRRHAKMNNLSKFDTQYFGVNGKQAHNMDPQLRFLMEVCHEAIVDAGINPMSIRGSKTGVFVGASGSETHSVLTNDPDTINGYAPVGCFMSMFANRISYSFDFNGPSFPVDTACSSGLLATNLAINAIRQGECDAAIVAAATLNLTATTALQFHRLGMLSKEGACKAFDKTGSGYARAETVAAVFLQKSSVARRIYATVVHAKSNTDGYKTEGITFPSGVRQTELLEQVYREAFVNPAAVSYVEAHGTGTSVGDPQEAGAITNIFCANRTDPLLIGSVKSNMGHSEPASGLCAIAKVVIAMEAGCLPPNLHFNEPNEDIPALLDGRMRVVTEPTPWQGGLVGINSFGFGGANSHVLLRSQAKEPLPRPIDEATFPRLLCIGGRTNEAVQVLLDAADEHADNPYFYNLLSETCNIPATLHPYRGYVISNRKDGAALMDIQKAAPLRSREVWFIYSGMGTQWHRMGQDLMQIDLFKRSVLSSSAALRCLGVDPFSLIMNDDEDVFKSTLNCMVCIAAIQIALTDLLRRIGVEPDGIIGHSTGEMVCGYADGALTREQAMLLAYHRGNCIVNGGLNVGGGMAAVGLTWEDAHRRVPEGVYPACHNGYDSVSISGDNDKVLEFVEELKKEEIFAKYVNSSGVPFHAPPMQKIKPTLTELMSKVIPEPKARSKRWVSTSVAEAEWQSELATHCSADYQVNNVMSPVLFYEALQKIPEDAVTIEVSPHSLLQAVLRRSLNANCVNVGLMKAQHENSVELLLQSLGRLYQAGVPVEVHKLYPAVTYPVPNGTPMISPLIRWDHSQDWFVLDFHKLKLMGSGGACVSFTVDAHSKDTTEDHFYLDHVIDGRPLFPFTGYVVLAWRAMCKMKNLDHLQTPFVVEDVIVFRPTLMSRAIKLDVELLSGDGSFQVMDDGSVAASGRISIPDEERRTFYSKLASRQPAEEDSIRLTAADCYKEFLLRGYEYGPHFRSIDGFSSNGRDGLIEWRDNFVTFLDALMQSSLLIDRSRSLRLPTRLRYLRVDPVKHLAAVEELDGRQMIRVRNCPATKGCLAGGVEMRDLTVQTVPRRDKPAARLILTKVYFVANHDDACLSLFGSLAERLGAYRSALVEALAALPQHWPQDVFSALPNSADLLVALQRLAVSSKPNALAGDATGKDFTFLQHLHRAAALELAEGETADAFAQRVVDCMRPEQPIVTSDLQLTSAMLQRPLKPLVDVVCENTAGHYYFCCSLESECTAAAANVFDMLLTHPLIDPEWTFVGPNVDALDDNAVEHISAKRLTLDIDSLTEEQLGELGKNFDMVLLDKLLSRKADVREYLRKASRLLRADGLAIVSEFTSDFEMAFAERCLTGSAILANSDADRKYGMFYDHAQWMDIFESCGLQVVNHQADPHMMCTAYLLHRLPEVPKEPCFVDVDDVDEFSWVEPLQTVIDERLREPEAKTIWLTSSRVRDNGTVGLALCLREESQQANRFRQIMDVSLATRDGPAALDLHNDPLIQQLVKEDIHANNYRDGTWGSFRHIVLSDKDVLVRKDTEHAFINTVVQGDLNSLDWVEGPNQYYDSWAPEQRQRFKLCSIYYTSLNFRDVLLAAGRLAADAIPGYFPDRETLLGLEYAGRMTDTGERVMGIINTQAFATTVVVDTNKRWTWKVPDNWTLEDAVTVPIVYSTAYYALFVRGNMQPGHRVLVHSGSGGVGQAAIAIALAHGCEVYTTVSTAEKQAFLQRRFPQLEDRHFSDSRTLEFESHIMLETDGEGVDIILNSLSEDKLQASVRCLARNSVFLEIGKVDMSANASLGMEFFLKNVSFHGILPDEKMEISHPDWLRVLELMDEGIKRGVVLPLPATVFSIDEPAAAFRFMGQGKHIGKVVMKVRDEEPGHAMPRPVRVSAVCRTYCSPTESFLITGGLGGFGLELADWLFQRGARNLILTSRSGVKTGYQARCVQFWKKNGASVTVSKLDIADEQQTAELIAECQKIGKLGGIFHLAMVLRDMLFENQNSDNFKQSAATKYWGTKNLDQVTRRMCGSELRWFVAFSSVASSCGNTGQTNYGWANQTMERIVEQRRHDGLAGVAVEWGAVGDVGVVLETLGDNKTLVAGTLPQRMPSCLKSMDMFLSWNHPIVSSYLRAETRKRETRTGDVVEVIAAILGVSDPSSLDLDANLTDFGLDSLMGVEIKQALERDFRVIVSMKDIRSVRVPRRSPTRTALIQLTLNKLRQMAAAVAAGSVMPAAAAAGDGDDVDLQLEMQQLFKLRLDVNDVLTTEKVVKLNESTEWPPVFLLHSIEGIGTPLKQVASRIPFACYCFQSTPEVPMDSIDSMAVCYMEEMRKIQPEGPYRLVGYSYGACIGFEMATRLQEQAADSVATLVLLDGSHHYMQTYRAAYRTAYGVANVENLTDSPLFETEILSAFTSRFVKNLDHQAFNKQLLACADWPARKAIVTRDVFAGGLFKKPEAIAWATESLRAKFLAADKFDPQNNFDGDVTLIRAEKGAVPEELVGADYGLSEVVTGTVHVEVVEGDHDSIVQGDNFEKTAAIITRIMSDPSTA